MNDDYLMLPTKEEMNELLEAAKQDIEALLKEDPEVAPQIAVLKEVLDALESLTTKHADFSKLDRVQTISIVAHLTLFEDLFEDFFLYDEDEFEFEEGELEFDDCSECDENDEQDKP